VYFRVGGSISAWSAPCRPGKDENTVCEKCEGCRHGQKPLDMAIVTSISKQGDEYTGGDILDPDNGELYRCK